jgi:hypothetical protein
MSINEPPSNNLNDDSNDELVLVSLLSSQTLNAVTVVDSNSIITTVQQQDDEEGRSLFATDNNGDISPPSHDPPETLVVVQFRDQVYSIAIDSITMSALQQSLLREFSQHHRHHLTTSTAPAAGILDSAFIDFLLCQPISSTFDIRFICRVSKHWRTNEF